ncbi:MAG TPA: DNA-directed RNA polymerase subunit beta' [Anaerolineae bacterium]|nr:DNA-directed RNA polymerase subunit beta' [Anaerolineae bacterium]
MSVVKDFKAMRLSLASPAAIRDWSYGEVTKPETINYRRLRPERDGLFCEAIFGPTRDWQCACGKYKHQRFRGVKCERCGVEVTRAAVRRERMGHIELAAPVAHIWYTRRVPSYLGLLLDISRRNMDRVLYFAQYVITHVDEDARLKAQRSLDADMSREKARLEKATEERIEEIELRLNEALDNLQQRRQQRDEELDERTSALSDSITSEVRSLERALKAADGKVAAEPIVASFHEEPLVAAGETVGRDHLTRLQEIATARLDQVEKQSEQETRDTALLISAEGDQLRREAAQAKSILAERLAQQQAQIEDSYTERKEELRSLQAMTFLPESRHHELHERWGSVFRASMGAEAFHDICQQIDLDALAKELRAQLHTTRSIQLKKKAAKRLKVVDALRKSSNRPEWMVLTVLPVIPPELRPMIQLDGGRFATSDLNDLYRRVVNRNNRLKRLLDLGAPDVIVRNEKRMLQEAVDSLIDNSRRGKAVSARGRRPLKSLSDMLKGKQGRFRRNLLGKRVDYSGRSVIVIGPQLELHQCGLPRSMALELFQPFVINRLVQYSIAINVKGAKRIIERREPEVWEVLEEVVKERPVLLNRAPTLHRLGIQAFEPVLVDGDAIQIHPLVCAAFNADFDGDQMAVHVPLSPRAVQEARELMLSTRNLLKPASGEPIVGPTKDMVLGCFYLTMERPPSSDGEEPEPQTAVPAFADMEEVRLAYDLGKLRLHSPILLRYRSWIDDYEPEYLDLSDELLEALANASLDTIGKVLDAIADGRFARLEGIQEGDDLEFMDMLAAVGFQLGDRQESRFIKTTAGRAIFNLHLPPQLRFVNDTMGKGKLQDLVGICHQRLGLQATAKLVDEIKTIGFHYATKSGLSIAVSDITVPPKKEQIIRMASDEVGRVEHQFRRGLITEEEQYQRTVEVWTKATDDITAAVAESLDPDGPIRVMAVSGATKGSFTPIRQLAGMRGLMADPAGRIIALPIRSNFREGLTALEYFISTHGARKGLADTALRTADAGYLTRRLVDVAQEMIIDAVDCGTRSGVWIHLDETKKMGQTMVERLLGRVAAAAVVHPQTGEVIVAAQEMIEEKQAEQIQELKIPHVYLRSPLTCQLRHGLCAMCYGRDLARGNLIAVGEAVGTIAAQSIGEPGTQLTLRTFHTGGVAGASDITHGLPRVQELFEARIPKGEAIVSDIDGQVEIVQQDGMRVLKVVNAEVITDEYPLPRNYSVKVQDEQSVLEGEALAQYGDRTIEATNAGRVFIERAAILVTPTEAGAPVAHDLPSNFRPLVEDGQTVAAGDALAQSGGRQIVSEAAGIVNVRHQTTIFVRHENRDVKEYELATSARLRVEPGSMVRAGEQLTEGSINPARLLRIKGREAAQMYLLGEIQQVYRSQGVSISDKHIEVIIRQMTAKVRVNVPGDTDLLGGELISRLAFQDINEEIHRAGGRRATARPVLLGITKAALNTDSFLAAASFQHTINVLALAAIEGRTDGLHGLKENVIIGKLIPAGTGFRRRSRASLDALPAQTALEVPSSANEE